MVDSVEFKFRKKYWKAVKESHGFSLQRQVGEEWNVVGYYSDPNEMFKRLVKENLLSATTQKEIAKTINETCESLTKHFIMALNGQICA